MACPHDIRLWDGQLVSDVGRDHCHRCKEGYVFCNLKKDTPEKRENRELRPAKWDRMMQGYGKGGRPFRTRAVH